MNGQVGEWMDGRVNGWMDGWVDGWMDDGWMDGWVDGWMTYSPRRSCGCSSLTIQCFFPPSPSP